MSEKFEVCLYNEPDTPTETIMLVPQWMIYIGYGSSAVVDTVNAVVLSFLLFKTSPRNYQRLKSQGVVRFLVVFFIGTGVLTTIADIASMIVCVKGPSSGHYLAIEFCRPRLLANSILVIFNSKARLRQRMEATSELKIPSELLFGDAPEGSTTDRPVAVEGAPHAT
ncbi:hypothetical protein D9619_009255 [Psilocybe cf. subviscida]|uniref:DUF6534 domain-containing protein n=1 Tax=Psilocybe cf. subviscida TaxID=2480587 RepID=A0A8H5BVJ1_9AGAR|nr:hypothetical protein D9619_009255 [Psilocybe cf. subviscida]